MARLRQNGLPGAAILGLGIVATAVIASCSSSAPPTVVPPVAPPVVPAVAADDAAAAVTQPVDDETGVPGYKLGPGDKIRLTVFRHTDLSGQFEVNGEGFFAMPLVGQIRSAGLTPRTLENEIEDRLKSGGYLVNPQVSVEVMNYRPFYIIGEVTNPGSYQYVNGMTVTNAVALAGGFTYRADHNDITITRGGSKGPETEVKSNAEVLPGDIIEVSERFF